MNPKYRIGQDLDTEAFGLCTVTDIFVSSMSDRIVYEVQTNDHQYFIIKEEEI